MSSAALAKRSVITPIAGTPCRSAAIESCKLHDGSSLIADAGDDGLPPLDLIDDGGFSRRAVVRLRPPDDVSDA